MATWGRGPLEVLKDSLDYIVEKRFTFGFSRLVTRLLLAYSQRNEIIGGGIVTQGASLGAGTFSANFTGLSVVLRGRRKAVIDYFVDQDLLLKAGSIEQPIYGDGSDASALSLGGGEKAYCALIVTNSDGAGGVDDTEDGDAKLILVVGGTATTYKTQTRYPTSAEVQAALNDADGVHDGGVRWAWVAQIMVNRTGPAMTIVNNRNNILDV